MSSRRCCWFAASLYSCGVGSQGCWRPEVFCTLKRTFADERKYTGTRNTHTHTHSGGVDESGWSRQAGLRRKYAGSTVERRAAAVEFPWIAPLVNVCYANRGVSSARFISNAALMLLRVGVKMGFWLYECRFITFAKH